MASNVTSSHELTLKSYQKQLKDNIKRIYDNYTEILATKKEHMNYEVQVKSAEIVRSYQLLMQLVADIRSFLIINDLISLNHSNPSQQQSIIGSQQQQQQQQHHGISSQQQTPAATQYTTFDEKLVKLRDEMSMFLYELEIPLP